MTNVEEIVNNIKKIYDGNSSLDTLIQFEKILDDMHMYAYKNWFEGEVIKGPEIERYWVRVTLMYPHELMPDPDGAKRLIDHGCTVKFGKRKYIVSGQVNSPDDMEMEAGTGKRKPKKEKFDVWFVEISVPRHLIDEYSTEKLEVNGVELDMGAITDASDNDLDTVKNISGDDDGINF